MDNPIGNNDIEIKLENPSTYEEYVAFCDKYNSNNRLSESEWNDAKSGNLRFATPALTGLATAAGNSLLRNAGPIANAMLSKGPAAAATVVVDTLKTDGISAAKEFIINTTRSSNSGKSNNSGGGGNSTSSVPSTGGPTGSPSSLTGQFETSPMTLDLKPGLPAAVYADTVNFPISRASYSHITGFRININGLDTATKFYFDNVLIPKLQNRAQQVVNFKVDLNILTSAKLINYFNKLISLLSIYYFCTSIISYCSVATNKDRGMWALRAMMTPGDIDILEQIRDCLPAFPIPPQLNSLLFWLYQNFTDGPNGQLVTKFMPVGFNDTSGSNIATGFLGTNSSVLTSALTGLTQDADCMAVSSLLTQIVPSWLKPKFLDSSPIVIYSPSFSTLFANAAHSYSWGTYQYFGPVVTADSDSIFYLSFDSVLDGLVLGLFTAYVNVVTVFSPGLAQPANTNVVDGVTRLCNRWSYCYKTSDNTYNWVQSHTNIESAFGRNELPRTYTQNAYYAVLPNSISVRGVNLSIVRESTKALLSWMLSTDTIVDRRKNKFIDKAK